MQMRIDDPKSDPDLRAAARMIYNNLVDAYEVLRDCKRAYYQAFLTLADFIHLHAANSRLKYDLSIGLVQEWPPAEEADCPPEQNPPNTSCNNPALPNTPANK